jgi:hypothetical protein
MLLSYSKLRIGAVVCSDNRFIFRGARIYLIAENEQWCEKASGHDYHSILLTTGFVNDVPSLFETVEHFWDRMKGASKPAHKYVAFVRSPRESVHEFVAAHFHYLPSDEPATQRRWIKRIITHA